MRKPNHTIQKSGKVNARKLAEFLSKNGQFLLPMVDLIEQCRLACDELIDVTGRATVHTIRELLTQQLTGGPPRPGKRREGEVV